MYNENQWPRRRLDQCTGRCPTVRISVQTIPFAPSLAYLTISSQHWTIDHHSSRTIVSVPAKIDKLSTPDVAASLRPTTGDVKPYYRSTISLPRSASASSTPKRTASLRVIYPTSRMFLSRHTHTQTHTHTHTHTLPLSFYFSHILRRNIFPPRAEFLTNPHWQSRQYISACIYYVSIPSNLSLSLALALALFSPHSNEFISRARADYPASEISLSLAPIESTNCQRREPTPPPPPLPPTLSLSPSPSLSLSFPLSHSLSLPLSLSLSLLLLNLPLPPDPRLSQPVQNATMVTARSRKLSKFRSALAFYDVYFTRAIRFASLSPITRPPANRYHTTVPPLIRHIKYIKPPPIGDMITPRGCLASYLSQCWIVLDFYDFFLLK